MSGAAERRFSEASMCSSSKSRLATSLDVISDRRLARVIEYMTFHFAERINLERLSREAGMSNSPAHFGAAFQRRYGESPGAFRAKQRA